MHVLSTSFATDLIFHCWIFISQALRIMLECCSFPVSMAQEDAMQVLMESWVP
jgi:hypothetical protein